MLKDEAFFAPFRTENTENVYELVVIVVQNGKTKQVDQEVVDAYRGEIGLAYARKLLFRMANHVLPSRFQEVVWEEYTAFSSGSNRKEAYIKKRSTGDYVLASLRWCDRLEKGRLSFMNGIKP